MAIDDKKLEAFMGKAMADMAGAATMPMVLLGSRLGFYRKLKRRAMTAQASSTVWLPWRSSFISPRSMISCVRCSSSLRRALSVSSPFVA